MICTLPALRSASTWIAWMMIMQTLRKMFTPFSRSPILLCERYFAILKLSERLPGSAARTFVAVRGRAFSQVAADLHLLFEVEHSQRAFVDHPPRNYTLHRAITKAVG